MIYKRIIRPILFNFNPETIHNLISYLDTTSFLMPAFDSPKILSSQLFGLNFPNPVGLAAGFDKNAKMINLCYKLGFGFTEIGSVSLPSSVGNKKPRLFRIPEDEAIINNMGANNDGVEKIISRLEKVSVPIPVGANIIQLPSSSDEDILLTASWIRSYVDYITLNISCPNVKNHIDLNSLLNEIKKDIPIFVKISPDISLNYFEQIIRICFENNITGFVISNTSLLRYGLSSYVEIEGGLSGPPLFERMNSLVKFCYSLTKGQAKIIGVGGINSAESAYQTIKNGASLVQLFTGLIYKGPNLIKKINTGLVKLLEQDNFNSIIDAIGVNI